MALEIAFKVDVCNRRALDEGVPGVAALLAGFSVPASFFVSFGPDHSGRALRRIFRRGFLTKMLRTRAPRMYGLRTLLYGTLLPGPPVGESAPETLRRLEDAGHEVGMHGFDHVGWHDGVARMGEAQVRASCQRARELFERTLGHPPRFSGAPGWQVTDLSLVVQEELGLAFASDCRGGTPFHPQVAGRRLATLQVPTTLPTSDEVLGAGLAGVDGLAAWYESRVPETGSCVIGLHAEAEGIHFSAWLERFVAGMQRRGARFLPVSEVARRAGDAAPAAQVVRREIPGRAGTVACPEPPARSG